MAIDPERITSVSVDQLPTEPFTLSDILPHGLGPDLKQGTVQSLADVIGAYLSSSEGVGFRAVTVNDGEMLPATTQQEFILVGPGTFINVGGGANITTTEELNALVSNGTYWFIGVEIPISAEAQNITQFVRDGFLNTTPSEDAVYELTKNHINDAIGTGSFVRTPGAWQSLDLALGDQTNTLFRSVCNVGLVDVQADAFQLARADDTHLNITGTSIGIIFPNFFHTLPAAPNSSIKQIPTNTNYPLSSLTGSLPAVGTQGVYYLGWRDSTQAFEIATTSYVQNHNVCQVGVIFLKNVGGVISFIDSTRTVIPMPDVAQYSNLETTAIGVKSNVFVNYNAGGMTVKNNTGSLVGLSVNYKGTNNDEKAIAANATTSFRRLNPGNANATTLPATTTTVVTSDYWNGSAMVALAANGNSSVQRWILTVMGTFILQPGETQYATFQDGKDNVYGASFTDIIPKGTFVEIGRLVATKDCTNLGDNNKAVFVGTGSGNGGGGSVSSVSFLSIAGFPEDNINLAASLSSKVDLTTGQTITGVKTFNSGTIGHRNVANTFTSFITNTNTASRTYTLPDFDGSIAAFNGSNLGIGTNSPTHPLTLSSTAATGGTVLYETADQTTNYSRLRTYFLTNQFFINSEKGGTGTGRDISIGTSSNNNTLTIKEGNSTIGQVRASATISTATGVMLSSAGTLSGGGTGFNTAIAAFPTVSQSGNQSYRALWLSPFESALGIGQKLLIDAGTNTAANGGGTHTSKFTVDNTGVTTASQFRLSALNTAPTTSTDTGTTGEIRVVNGFIYVCVATNTWQRATLSTF